MNQKKMRPKNGTILRNGKYATTEYVTGPSRKGPKRCLHCQKAFKRGEPWQRHASPEDPKFGAYVIGIHTACAR